MLTEVNKSTEANKASVRRFYDEVFNKKNRAAIDEFIAPNHVDHAAPPGTPGGLKGVKQTLTMYLTAFPDLHFTVEDIRGPGCDPSDCAWNTARCVYGHPPDRQASDGHGNRYQPLRGRQERRALAQHGHPGLVATTRRDSCARTIGIRPDSHMGCYSMSQYIPRDRE
jgi:hypothetical protein